MFWQPHHLHIWVSLHRRVSLGSYLSVVSNPAPVHRHNPLTEVWWCFQQGLASSFGISSQARRRLSLGLVTHPLCGEGAGQTTSADAFPHTLLVPRMDRDLLPFTRKESERLS